MDEECTTAPAAPDVGSAPLTGQALPLSDVAEEAVDVAWAMVDASPDALVMVDEHGVIELVNRQTEILFGFDRGELLGRPVETLLPEESAAVHRAHRTRFRAAPEVRSMGSGMDLLARRADGTQFPVEVSLSPMEVNGELRVIAAVRDISERVALEMGAQRVRRGIDSIQDGVYMIDADTMAFVYVNQGAANQTGYGVEELVEAMTPLHLTPDFTVTSFAELLRPLADNETEAVHFETTLRPRSGEDFPVEVIIEFPQLDTAHQRVFVAVVRDISKRVALETAANRIRRGIDSIRDGVYMVEPNSMHFVYVNKGAITQSGYRAEELLGGMTPSDLSTQDGEDLREVYRPLVEGSVPLIHAETTLRPKTGEAFPVEVIIELLEVDTDQQQVFAIVVRDISQRIAIEQQAHIINSSIDAVTDAVFVCDESTLEFLHVNQGAVELHGYTDEELLAGMTPAALAPDLAPEDLAAALAELADTPGDSAQLLTRGVRKDGTEVPVDVRINWPLPATPGGPRPVVAVVRDITAEVEAEQIRRRHEALNQGLSDVRSAMLQGATRRAGLSLICEAAATTLDAGSAMILTPISGDTDELRIEATANITDSIKERLSFRSTQGGVGEVFKTGRPRFTSAPSHPETPETVRNVLDRHVGSLLMAPLPGSDGEVAGVLIVIRDKTGASFTEADVDPIGHYATGAAAAMTQAAATETRNALELLEDRERIGRDMHDIVIGRLFATGMALQSTTSRVDDAAVLERLNTAVAEIDEAIKEIRTAVYGIPSRTDWGKGTRGELLAIAADQRDHLGFEPQVTLAGPINELPAPIVDQLLATVREALTNTAKHAQARSVTLNINVTDQTLALHIKDDGIGFDPDDLPDQSVAGGHGLANIIDRAETLGGTATIHSTPGQGTTLDWTIPISNK